MSICNIDKESPNINNYDLIIIGSPIRFGLVDKKIKKLINQNLNTLLKKKIAFFICCGFSENTNTYFLQNIPKELTDKSIISISFGGEMIISNQKGLDKLVAKLVTKKDKRIVEIDNNSINKFINIIKEMD